VSALTEEPTDRRAAPAPTAGIELPRRRARLVVALATALAAALCAYRLGARGVWVDEAFTIGLVRMPYADFLERIARWEVNQSPYYLVFDLWHRLSEDPAVMRALSAAFAVATVPVVHRLGRRLHDERVGAIAAVLVAVNGLVVEWGQQLRGYTMVLLLVAVASLLLVRAVDRPGTGSAVAFAVVAVLATYTNFFAALVVAAQGLSLLLVRPFPRRLVVIAGAILVLPLVRIAAYVSSATTDPLGWIENPGGRGLLRNLAEIAGGGPLQLAAWGAAFALGAAASWRAVRHDLRAPAAWRHLMPLAWAVLPVVAVVAVTYTVKPLLLSRYLIVVVPGVALVAAVGLASLPRRSATALAGAGLVAVALVGVWQSYGDAPLEDWEAATATVLEDLGPDDAVAVGPRNARPAFEYYLRRAGRDDVELVAPEPGDPAPAPVLWEVRYAVGPTPRTLPTWDPLRDYEVWRDRHYELVQQDVVDRITLERYRRR
jgi:mannosyltransferase